MLFEEDGGPDPLVRPRRAHAPTPVAAGGVATPLNATVARRRARVRRVGLLVLDFDGTLWRGDEPLTCYAELVSKGLAPEDRASFLADVRGFLEGDHWRVTGLQAPPDDAWAAVARFATARGVSSADRQAAFLETRRRIAEGAFHLEVPAGLPEFLAASRASCAVVLASNSPASSVQPVLDRLGLTPLLDEVTSDAGKPDRFTLVVDAWIERYRPRYVMSVGDHYHNDIAPAAERGWFTTYINPWRWVYGPCSLVGARMEDVLPGLGAWVEAITDHRAAPVAAPRPPGRRGTGGRPTGREERKEGNGTT